MFRALTQLARTYATKGLSEVYDDLNFTPTNVAIRQARDKPTNAPYRLDLTGAVPPPEPDGSFTFLAVGDSGQGGDVQGALGRLMARDCGLRSAPAHHPPLPNGQPARFIAHLGDVVYLIGSERFYWPNFFEPYRDFVVRPTSEAEFAADPKARFRVPILPIYGNHDYYKLGHVIGFLYNRAFLGAPKRIYEALLGSQTFGQGSDTGRVFDEVFIADARAEATGDPFRYADATRIPHRYYCYSYGCADFFALDSNTLDAATGEEAYDEAQMDWLKSELDRSERERPDAWRILVLHHPFLTQGANHCEERTIVRIRESLRPLVKGRIDLILTGHSHTFEHLIDEPTCIPILITGGGRGMDPHIVEKVAHYQKKTLWSWRGRLLRRFRYGPDVRRTLGRSARAFAGTREGAYHYLRLRVTPTELTAEVVGLVLRADDNGAVTPALDGNGEPIGLAPFIGRHWRPAADDSGVGTWHRAPFRFTFSRRPAL